MTTLQRTLLGAGVVALLVLGTRAWFATPQEVSNAATPASSPEATQAVSASNSDLAKPTQPPREPEVESIVALDDDARFDQIAKSFDPARERFFRVSSQTLPDCLKLLQDPRINPDKKFLHGKKAKDFCAIQERYASEILPLYWRYTGLRDESFDALRKTGKYLDPAQAKLAMKTPGAVVSIATVANQATEDPATQTLSEERYLALMPGDVPDLDAMREQIAALKEQAALEMRNALAGY